MPNFNFIDIIILIPTIWFAYKGYKHGLIMELVTLLALFAGIWMTIHFSDIIAAHFDNTYLARTLAFTILFVGTLLLGYFAGKIIEKIVKIVIPAIINNVLGMLFGVVKVFFVFSCILYIISMMDTKEVILKPDYKTRSTLYQYTVPIFPAVKHFFEAS